MRDSSKLLEGAFTVASDADSQSVFGKIVGSVKAAEGLTLSPGQGSHNHTHQSPIELCVLPSVSGAFCAMRYEEKRRLWLERCFQKEWALAESETQLPSVASTTGQFQ